MKIKMVFTIKMMQYKAKTLQGYLLFPQKAVKLMLISIFCKIKDHHYTFFCNLVPSKIQQRRR